MVSRGVVVGVLFVLIVVLYAGLSGLWVSTDAGWYAGLPRPPWQPPDWVFGTIWPLNFLALGIAGVVLAREAPDLAGVVLAVFALSVVFALAWAYLFYVPHALGWSAVSLAVAAVLTWLVVALAARAVGWTGLLLTPYAVWMTVATSLAVWYSANV